MNTKDFIHFLSNENAVKNMDLKQLDSVLDSFPYFQTARMMYLKNLKINNNFLFNSWLKTTAAFVGDRTVLFEYITKEVETFDDEEPLPKSKDLESEVGYEVESENENLVTQENKIQEDESDTHKVISFSADDRFSFNEWLQLSNVKEIHRKIDDKIDSSSKEEKISKTGNSKFDLIDKFIDSNPRLKPKPKEDVVSGNIALSGTKENEGWMTETLAQVYIEQKKYSKAIKAYKILGLKYPEKSGFFADRIRAIKKLSEY